ncbi:hypothetical protein BO99DRAFT_254957 [Aspergillus violaceofuscus CBS 115571]|uniref:Uncharacterized protein n=1 Tax=Aspergillus violaceofuscus (strain CBS 115571) TaxID=1450538 RepID=A0A2V5GVK4_ASPV1|nr:hypothetical protein BO99DRAFT_254957 [Aspergillus violaceofuscus CBS 115571]
MRDKTPPRCGPDILWELPRWTGWVTPIHGDDLGTHGTCSRAPNHSWPGPACVEMCPIAGDTGSLLCRACDEFNLEFGHLPLPLPSMPLSGLGNQPHY